MMGGTAYYLYCILPEGRLPHLGEGGIDGRAVFTTVPGPGRGLERGSSGGLLWRRRGEPT